MGGTHSTQLVGEPWEYWGADKVCFRTSYLTYGNFQVEVPPQFQILDACTWMPHQHNPNFTCSSNSLLFLITSVGPPITPLLQLRPRSCICSPFLTSSTRAANNCCPFHLLHICLILSFLSFFTATLNFESSSLLHELLTWPPGHQSYAHPSFSYMSPWSPLSSDLIMWLSCWTLFLAPLIQGWRHYPWPTDRT